MNEVEKSHPNKLYITNFWRKKC